MNKPMFPENDYSPSPSDPPKLIASRRNALSQRTAPGPSDATACCASSFLDASFEIGAEYEALNHRVDAMMKTRGWKHTCKTPGSIWLWEKTMPDGRVILTDRGTAGALEAQMCHEESLHNETSAGTDASGKTL